MRGGPAAFLLSTNLTAKPIELWLSALSKEAGPFRYITTDDSSTERLAIRMRSVVVSRYTSARLPLYIRLSPHHSAHFFTQVRTFPLKYTLFPHRHALSTTGCSLSTTIHCHSHHVHCPPLSLTPLPPLARQRAKPQTHPSHSFAYSRSRTHSTLRNKIRS